ncbi:MAG: ComEC/Rec2 family competence protein [Thermoplasmatota archaeon]
MMRIPAAIALAVLSGCILPTNPVGPQELTPLETSQTAPVAGNRPAGGGQIVPNFADNLTMTAVGPDGPAVLLQTRGVAILFDTGAGANATELIQTFQSRGVNTIDFLFLGSLELGHVGGCPAVAHEFVVKRAYFPTDPGGAPCAKALAAAGVPTAPHVAPGQLLRLGEHLGAEILHSDGSLVVRFDYGAFSAILLGDGTCPTESAIADSGMNLHVRVIELLGDPCDAWLGATTPATAFVVDQNATDQPGQEGRAALRAHGITLYPANTTFTSDGANITIQVPE